MIYIAATLVVVGFILLFMRRPVIALGFFVTSVLITAGNIILTSGK